jgi:hypothetical protein
MERTCICNGDQPNFSASHNDVMNIDWVILSVSPVTNHFTHTARYKKTTAVALSIDHVACSMGGSNAT